MKKLILATALILSMALVSYGKTNSKNKDLVSNLSSALKTSQTTLSSQSGNFSKTSFSFNGKLVSAFYDVENDDLIGFTIPMSATDLQAGTIENIQKRFSKYTLQDVVMFIERDGYFGFYVSMTRTTRPGIVLRINPNGKASYYSRM